MKVIAFAGMPGSGKSEAVRVARELGIPVVRIGDCVWDEVKKRGLELKDENVGRVADEMRKKHGMDIWARRALERIDLSWSKVVIDGIRNLEEVDYFRNNLGEDFILVAIHASPETRYRRLLGRGRSDDNASIGRIRERDERELRWGLGILIALADVIVVNEESLEKFRSKVRALIEQ
jgi:dephospho-CoA kinase